ncbi:MAG TPA: hypothetical protein VHY08_12960 [Bacillota bacterium]|nr:hypothetical protein [Bacillota bacterium]
MNNRMIRYAAFILFILTFMVVIFGVGVMAQTNTSAPNFASELSSVINGLGLPQDKYETSVKLTTGFLAKLQNANQELTQLMTSQVTGSQTAGSQQSTGTQLDPKSMEKIIVVQREFGIKLEEYKLDLGDAIGESNATKITEKVQQIIPKVLLQNSQIAAADHSSHSGMTGMSGMPTPTPQVNGPAEVPLGGTSSNSGNSNTGTMFGMSMPGMNTTPGMNNMPGMTMPGMTPNNTTGTGNDAVNKQILVQLQTSNSMLIQMLSIISAQLNSENLKAQLQPIYQMIANQSTLIQMLYNNLSAGTMNSGSGNSTGSGMGNMGGMGGMGMM